jgi:NAD(P)-dependent dehydrogenase (short-subunit alcohol dehydrogenase family)
MRGSVEGTINLSVGINRMQLLAAGISAAGSVAIAGHVGIADFSLYNASKHAVEGLTKTAALEFAGRSIRVNTVAPAFIAAPMVERFVGAAGDVRQQLAALHPVGRLGHVDEVVPRSCSCCRTSRSSRGASHCLWMSVGRRREAQRQAKAGRLRPIPSTSNRPL